MMYISFYHTCINVYMYLYKLEMKDTLEQIAVFVVQLHFMEGAVFLDVIAVMTNVTAYMEACPNKVIITNVSPIFVLLLYLSNDQYC